MFFMKKMCTWLCLVLLITGCGGAGGGDESSGDNDDNSVVDNSDNGGVDNNTQDDSNAVAIDQPDSISGHFAVVDSSSSSRTSRVVSNTTVQLINATGEVIASATTDGDGKFEFTNLSPLDSDDVPLHLTASSGGQTYYAPFIAQTGSVSANITDLSTAAHLYDSGQPITTLARLETVSQVIMMNRFGINELGNPNVSPDTFLTADLSNSESLANILIEAASNSDVNLLQDAPEGQPWMSNTGFVDALATSLQNTPDASVALAEVSSQAGSSRLAATLTDMAEATTEEERNLNMQNLISSIEETIETLQSRLQSLTEELSQNPEAPTDSSVTVTALAINGVSELNEQSSSTFTATVIYSDQTSQTVTAFWKVIGNGEAVIDSTGNLMTGEINSSTTISLEASYGGKTASVNVLIKDTDATLLSIEIKGNSSIQEQATGQYTVTATYDDGTTQTVQPTWSENSVDAVIDSTGTLRTFEVASDNIVTLTASFNGKTATKNVLIENLTKEVLLLQISGVSEMDEQSTSTFAATVTYDDLSTAVISPSWSVSSGGFATIDSGGTVLAGQVTSSQAVTLTASFNGKTATKTVLIRNLDKTVISLAISGNTSVTEQSTATYTAMATYDDGSTAAISPSWSVDGSGLATVDSGGVVTVGSVITDTTVTLTASFGGKTATKTISIQNQTKAVLSLAVSGTASIDEATNVTFTAIATYDDETSETVSPSWSVDGSGLATIDSGGVLRAATVSNDTSVTVTAEFSGKSATKTVTIKDVNTPSTFTLSTGVTGSGTITSNPTGIDCGTDCSEVYPEGQSVTLTAAATSNYFFTGWSGDCSGTTDCGLAMNADKTANATFALADTITINLAGTGTVTEITYNVSCTENCSMTLPATASVSLTATPASDLNFNGWLGACQGLGTCNVNVANNVNVTAVISKSQVELTDVTKSQSAFFHDKMEMVLDSTNSKILIVTRSASTRKLMLYRCDVDGSDCEDAIDISAGQNLTSGEDPVALLDSTNSKLLVVTRNAANSGKPSLFRCNLDGTGCTHTDISAGRGTDSGLNTHAAIDLANSKLLTVSRDGSNSNRLTLYRCDLDGTDCTSTDISLGIDNAGETQVVVDTINSKLLVVVKTASFSLALHRCNLDGTSCSYSALSTTDSYRSFVPRALLDTTHAKLSIVHYNGVDPYPLYLLRCDLDGTDCTHTDISSATGKNFFHPTPVLDLNRSKLIVTAYETNTSVPSVIQCNLDGSSCSFTDISMEYTRVEHRMPTVLDSTNSRLLTVGGIDFTPNQNLYLHRVPLTSSGSSASYAASCKAALDNNQARLDGGSGSGIYRINPTGSGTIDVFCDMETQGGGWTMVMALINNEGTLWNWNSNVWSTTSQEGTMPSASTNISQNFVSSAYSRVPGSDLLIRVNSNASAYAYNTGCLSNTTLRDRIVNFVGTQCSMTQVGVTLGSINDDFRSPVILNYEYNQYSAGKIYTGSDDHYCHTPYRRTSGWGVKGNGCFEDRTWTIEGNPAASFWVR